MIPAIPDYVLEALEQVYNDTEIDMLDKDAVLANLDLVYQEAADWLRANPSQYPVALDELSTQQNGGREE